ncbi:hypothetical protein BCR44DRAFT_330623 [Catenaria anguillulae PL171]|uniref:NAD(P)-binding domain-containing protein n=1 Tax=Catenaria anguillulae PL171 TaxID=765915 RepID=A0A1Y2HL39_9FUNG|nr:hypothetical protein BCR44DRAFT_330623 [Catenaria anguillulae PL171]
MTIPTPNKSVAFFGATGGSTLAALFHSLSANFSCSVLVRTPAKLTDLLASKYSYHADTSNLRIIQGNAKDIANVTSTLVDPATGHLPDVIVFGIGGVPVFTPNPFRPTLDDPHVCESTSATIFTALANLIAQGKTTAAGGKPLMGVVSTTGIPPGPRDIPIAWIPLYHWLLPVPHADKSKMETNVERAKADGLIRDFVIVRPTLLTDGKRTFGVVRAGCVEQTEQGEGGSLSAEQGGCGWKSAKGMAVGYFVAREDVGSFMFEEVVVKDGGEGGRWLGKRVTLSN